MPGFALIWSGRNLFFCNMSMITQVYRNILTNNPSNGISFRVILSNVFENNNAVGFIGYHSYRLRSE